MSANSNQNRKKTNAKSTGRTIALLILMCICLYAWHTHNSGDANTQEAAQAEAAETDTISTNFKSPSLSHSKSDYGRYGNLEKVKIPEGVKSQMIDYKGFTVSFNSEYKQPNYVVWELTGEEVRNMGYKKRYDNFQPDENVEGCPSLDDYRGSGFDRGHMAPAGDMKWNRKATEDCFLLTNMSPQHHALNSGTWLDVEEKCRDWAVRDSAIVIICGPVLTDKITRTIGKSHVAVPERYFKVILSPFSTPPMGIAFLMSNNKHNGGMQSTAVSIDEVERVTGFDFFPTLPDNIEDKIEAECNFPKWNHR